MSLVRKRPSAAAQRAAKIARLSELMSSPRSVGRLVQRVDPGYIRSGGYYGRFTGPNAELKFFDTALTFSVDATMEVPATGQLVLIPQGVTESTRVGRKCIIKSIEVKGTIADAPAAAANAASSAYVWLVLDKQCNGAAAAATDVFTSTAAQTALINLANSERFVILKKWVWSFNSSAGVTTAYNNTRREFEYYRRCNIPIEFSSTTGAITEIKSNNLFLLAGAVGGDDTSGVTGICRVRFSDQ